MIEEVGIRLRTDGAVEASNGTALAGAGVEKLGRQAQAAAPQLDRLGVSVGQTRQAMRQLPAQITDVVTSLASGQQAWLVAIQQGGQIKDSFGGAVPAMRALAGALSPLTVALGVVGVAAGVATYGFIAGQRESYEYAKAIIMTGNAAGVTAGQLQQMARSIADGGRSTESQAAEALAAVISTGRVAAAQAQAVSDAVLGLSRATGQSVQEAARVFAELGKDPVGASAKLNEQVNYLTSSIFRQIVALKQQGKESEAAALAQITAANALNPRFVTMQQNLGYVERAWNAATGAVKGFGSAVLGVGRTQSLQTQIDIAEERLKSMPLSDRARDAATRRIAQMRAQMGEEQRKAEETARAAAAVRTDVAAAAKPAREAKAPREQFYDAHLRAFEESKKDEARIVEAADRAETADYRAQLMLRLNAEREMRERQIEEERATEKIFLDMYALRPEKMKPVWQEMLEGWRDTNQQMQDTWDASMNATLRAGEDAWVQWAQTGKLNIKSVAQAWLAEQARGAFRNLVGSLFKMATGGGGTEGLARPGDLFHSGGIAGGTPTSRRVVAASTWNGAPRMHGGGIASDEVPAILKKKEGVFTEEQMRALAPVDRVRGSGRPTVVMQVTNHIDSRTDRAEVAALVQGAMRNAQAELVERMDRGEM